MDGRRRFYRMIMRPSLVGLVILPTLMASTCRSPKNIFRCPGLMAAFSQTSAFDFVKNKDCFNFCNGKFVDNNVFFFGTTECNGLAGGMPYVSGCTLAHMGGESRVSAQEADSSSASSAVVTAAELDPPTWNWREPSDESSQSGFFRFINGVSTWISGEPSTQSSEPDATSSTTFSTATTNPVIASMEISPSMTPTTTIPSTDTTTSPITTTPPPPMTVTLEASTPADPFPQVVQTAPGSPQSATSPINVVTTVTGPTSIETQSNPGLVFGGSITSVTVSGSSGTSTTSLVNEGQPIGVAPGRFNTAPASTTTPGISSSSSNRRCSEGKRKNGSGCRSKGKGKRGSSRSQSYETLTSAAGSRTAFGMLTTTVFISLSFVVLI